MTVGLDSGGKTKVCPQCQQKIPDEMLHCPLCLARRAFLFLEQQQPERLRTSAMIEVTKGGTQIEHVLMIGSEHDTFCGLRVRGRRTRVAIERIGKTKTCANCMTRILELRSKASA